MRCYIWNRAIRLSSVNCPEEECCAKNTNQVYFERRAMAKS